MDGMVKVFIFLEANHLSTPFNAFVCGRYRESLKTPLWLHYIILNFFT